MKHFTLILFFCSQIIFAQYEWNYVGEAGFSAGSVSFVDVELDIGGMPYVIFTDAGDNNEQKTYRFYQESWVGAGGGTNPPHLHNSLAIGANNYPLISSFGESFAELEVYFIVSINSQTGTIVQGANYPTNSGNPITGCTMNSVMVYDNGVAYVAHGTSSNSINVWRNNNYLSTSSNWSSEQVIGGGGSLGFSYDVKFGKSVTAWSRANNSGKLSISLDDYGINNDEITFDGLSDSNAIDIAVEVSDNLEYFVAFKDVANGGKASVLKFDGVDTWNYLGGAGFTSSQASFIDITTDISGTPYIVYQDASAAGRLSVQKYNQANDEWEFIGQEGFTDGVGSYCKIEIDNSNYLTPQQIDQMSRQPDMILEFAHFLKKEFNDTIIAFLTARSEVYSQIAGFEVGGDDYIKKPYSLSVLLAKVKVIIKRYDGVAQKVGSSDVVSTQLEAPDRCGNLRIDKASETSSC